jgi:hypothetical protein
MTQKFLHLLKIHPLIILIHCMDQTQLQKSYISTNWHYGCSRTSNRINNRTMEEDRTMGITMSIMDLLTLLWSHI